MINFKKELLNPKVKCFILDSGSKPNHDDVDFEQYNWDTSRNGKPNSGDLFIYRRSGKYSEFNHEFYLFGAGRLGKIKPISANTSLVISTIEEPFVFPRNLFRADLDGCQLSFRKNPNNWMYSFDQYGMTSIDKRDFFKIIELLIPSSSEDFQLNEMNNSLTVKFFQDGQRGKYNVPDKIGKVKTRGVAQQIFSEKVKSFYSYKCAITGISTKEFLVASHIIPWAVGEEHRLDPRNGICLSSLWDKAFDQGFISFDNSGRLLISCEVYKDKALSYQIDMFQTKKIIMNKPYPPKQEYLEYHRKNIFKS